LFFLLLNVVVIIFLNIITYFLYIENYIITKKKHSFQNSRRGLLLLELQLPTILEHNKLNKQTKKNE